MATHAFLRDGGPWQKSKGIPSCSLRVCVKHWGNRPKKTKPKQQMYVKTIHVHKTYAILWRKHGKNMFKLESYKPISRSRHSSLHLWLHMATKQPPRVCAVGKWSNVTTDMARNGSMCSFHLHLVQPTAPSLLGSTSRNGFSMLQLPHFRILYLQFPQFQQPEPKINKYQQYVENNHGFPQNDLHSCWGFP